MNIFKTNKQLRKEIEDLKDEIERLSESGRVMIDDYHDLMQLSTAERVIEQLIVDGIEYFDINNKTLEERRNYYREAQEFLNSGFVKNEVKSIVADIISRIAMEATTMEEVRDLRMTINGLQLLRDRALKVLDPEVASASTENIHNAL